MSVLIVAMNGIEVGHLSLQKSGAMSFQYQQGWLDRPGARAISLSLPLRKEAFEGEQVFNFLPDSDAIRARMQARFSISSRHPFNLLSAVGRDCIGAIQLYAEDELQGNVHQVTSEALTESDIAMLLRGYQDAPLGMEEGTDFRISLPASKAKMAMSVKGKNRHYHWQRIEPRHFINTAKSLRFSESIAREQLHMAALTTAEVIEKVENALPRGFPEAIATAIFTGLQGRANVILDQMGAA